MSDSRLRNFVKSLIAIMYLIISAFAIITLRNRLIEKNREIDNLKFGKVINFMSNDSLLVDIHLHKKNKLTNIDSLIMTDQFIKKKIYDLLKNTEDTNNGEQQQKFNKHGGN